MSNLAVFDIKNPGEGVRSLPLPAVLLDGHPEYRTWVVDNTGDGKIRTGIWEATPGSTRSSKGKTWEFCTILSGVIELTEDGQEPRRFVAGDTFVMKPGFLGVWKTIETVRKLWVIVS